MRDRFNFEIESLKQRLLDLATSADRALVRAIRAVDGTAEDARAIIANDASIDAEEVSIEEECLKLMALYQPVAGDLRLIVTILKVNGELERVADLASNIAARAIDLAADPAPPADCRFDFAPIVERAHKMLRGALDAFVCHRPDLARKLILDDDAVDALNAACYADAREKLIKHPAHAGRILDGVTISHCIERIADIATNICEDVIYLEEGQIVRHQKRLAQ